MKTGHTEAAGYCLIATAKRGDADKSRRLISVVLGTTSDVARTQESQKLLNYGYQFFDSQRLYKKNEPIATPEIFKGTQNAIKLGFDRDIWLTLPKDKFTGMKATLTTTQPLIAPYAPGQKAGVMKLTQNDKLIAEIPVVALENVPVAGFLGRWDGMQFACYSNSCTASPFVRKITMSTQALCLPTVYLNGDYLPIEEAKISPLDRGFIFGDGVYEVIPYYAGRGLRAVEHLKRLQRSLDELDIANPYSIDQWQSILATLIEKNGGGNVGVYIQVTRGVAKRDFPRPPVSRRLCS